MKHWPSWLLIGILTGCAAEPVQLPDWEIPDATVEATQPLPLPNTPNITLTGEIATISAAGLRQLIAYRETAEANTIIAAENAAALEAQAAAYNDLIQAGKFMVEIARIRQQQLDVANRQLFIDRQLFRAAVLLGLALAL